jgi:Transposase
VVFFTKEFTDISKPLAPMIRIDLDLPDGTGYNKIAEFKPDEFSASHVRCDVRIGVNSFSDDLRTYKIIAKMGDIAVEVSLTGEVPAWRPRTGYWYFGANDEHEFNWLPAFPHGKVDATYSMAGTSVSTAPICASPESCVSSTIMQARSLAATPTSPSGSSCTSARLGPANNGAECQYEIHDDVPALLIERAHAAGFASVTVACEPTAHRWRVLDQLAAWRGLPLVCVQPLLVWRAREAEDLTWDKSDPKDAMLIARLAAERRCYKPERTDATWARLRHLGARRDALTTEATAAVQQLRDLLEYVWPAVLATVGSPAAPASQGADRGPPGAAAHRSDVRRATRLQEAGR